MTYNERFFDLYKQLEFAVARKLPKKVWSPIAVYMGTLPSNRAGQLDQMRKFRNASPGHGVGYQPTVPYEWITFLNNEIRNVDNGGSAMETRLVQSMVKLESRSKSSQHGAAQNRTNQSSSKSSSYPERKQNSPVRQSNTKQSAPMRQSNSKQSAPARQSSPRPANCASSSAGQIKDGHRYSDKAHDFNIDLQIKKGQGRITKKAPFSSDKKQMVDFSVYFDYSGKLTDYNAQLLTKTGPKAIKLKRGENKMQIPASEIAANTIKVKLSFEYKVGMFTTKKDAMTVGRSV